MAEYDTPASWDRPGLSALGFAGFVPFSGQNPADVPDTEGVYVLVRESPGSPKFLTESPARVKVGRVAAYDPADLSRRWHPRVPVVYIGMAGRRNGRGGLRTRLAAFRRMSSGHAGGRSIWQLADASDLLIGWLEMPAGDPDGYETSLLNAFEKKFGGPPYANRRRKRLKRDN